MSDAIVGEVYAIERPDLMKVYVGQTINLKERLCRHRGPRGKHRYLFADIEPRVIRHGKFPIGHDLNSGERWIAWEYAAEDWEVVSRNLRHVGFGSKAGLNSGITTEQRSKGGKAAMRDLTPEQRSQRGVTNMSVRRQCAECEAVMAPSHLGTHQKFSGHVGYIDLPPEHPRSPGTTPRSRRRTGVPAWKLRRQCAECGRIRSPGSMALHQKFTGHAGVTVLPPID